MKKQPKKEIEVQIMIYGLDHKQTLKVSQIIGVFMATQMQKQIAK